MRRSLCCLAGLAGAAAPVTAAPLMAHATSAVYACKVEPVASESSPGASATETVPPVYAPTVGPVTVGPVTLGPYGGQRLYPGQTITVSQPNQARAVSAFACAATEPGGSVDPQLSATVLEQVFAKWSDGEVQPYDPSYHYADTNGTAATAGAVSEVDSGLPTLTSKTPVPGTAGITYTGI
jgi:hypothetical protein